MEERMRYLEMIQGVINRLASNSFSLKEWTVAFITGVTVLFEGYAKENYLLIIVLILMFWILDSYYLHQERLYRALYNAVQNLPPTDNSFSLDTLKYKNDKKNSTLFCMFSLTEVGYYISFIIAVIITYTLMK